MHLQEIIDKENAAIMIYLRSMHYQQRSLCSRALILFALVTNVISQESGWQANQVNASMCQWQLPRVGVIRDTVYIDGGFLYWEPVFADGSTGAPTYDGNPLGLVYALNFSTPFNKTSNMSQILNTIPKAPNGGAANNIGPQFYDGAMFANDDEFLTYGGLLSVTDAYEPPAEDEILGYQQYASGPPKQFFSGFVNDRLPIGMTRYITGGASVSIPSENKGYYFGGLQSAEHGTIYYTSSNTTTNADVLSNTLISVDLSTQGREVWENQSLPSTVPGRANAELVFVPVSLSGVLVAVGGVINPVDATVVQGLNESQTAESERVNPTFMSTVSIYDISSGTWYTQSTFGQGPDGLTQGCTVVASAADGSSHNVYWYGGYDGIDLTNAFSDDVWVLSIPSFIWIKVTSGIASHGRAGHRCVKPYPDQMIVIGGYTTLSGIEPTCVTDNIILNYNLSSNQWLESYSPLIWSEYTVPDSVFKEIGGNGYGGASSITPSTWSNETLQQIFSTPYDTSKIQKWYPYTLTTANNSNNSSVVIVATTKKQSLPTYVIAIIAVSGGFACIIISYLAYRIYCRRATATELFEDPPPGETASETQQESRIMTWMRGTSLNGGKKPATVISETIYDFDDSTTISNFDQQPFHEVGGIPNSTFGCNNSLPMVSEVNEVSELNEAGGNTIYEMMDSSQIAELPDTSIHK